MGSLLSKASSCIRAHTLEISGLPMPVPIPRASLALPLPLANLRGRAHIWMTCKVRNDGGWIHSYILVSIT